MVDEQTKEKEVRHNMAFDNWQGRDNGVLSRADIRDRFQDAAQIFFDRTGKGVEARPTRPAPAVLPPPKADHTPAYIAAGAAILAAIIVTRRQ